VALVTRTRKILIADDSPVEAEHIAASIRTLSGVEVVLVEDGASAVRECKSSRYDLVLCDYEMPGLNGLQLVRVLRTTWSRLELPILMLTVRDDVQTKVLSLRQGANDYVTKPPEPEELLARVQAQLELKAAVEANVKARLRILEGRKLATIGRLAAGLAHDLNTPAQFTADNLVFLQKVVAGTAELLTRTRAQLVEQPEFDAAFSESFLGFWKQRRLDYLLAEAPKALEESLRGIMRMARTVRELKEFAGLPESIWALADVNRALENTVAVSRQLWASAAHVSLQLEPGLPPIGCDVTALKHAFFDILTATVERVPKSSKVPRQLLQIEIRSARAPDGVELRFRDDGPTPPPELVPRLLESMFPSELGELGDDPGLGMAYSVVVGQHRGQLLYDSTPGQGVTLIVRLPEGKRDPRGRELSVPEPPSSRRKQE
jgi:DNA-binding response OmpR family regulator